MGSSLGGGKGSSSSSDNSSSYENALASLASLETGYGSDIGTVGFDQYAAGASGQLTPAQQALVTQSLEQMNTGTESSYSALGLGGSTMEQQDLDANQLSSGAQQANLEAQSEELGLSGLGTALSFLNGGGGALTNAANINNQQNQQNSSAKTSLASALGGMGGSGSGSGSGSGIASLLSGLFSGSGSSGSGATGGLFDTTNPDAIC